MRKLFTLSDFSLELQVLILVGKAAICKKKNEELETLLTTKNIDWEKVYELASNHRIRPLLLRGLSSFSLDLPVAFMKKIKSKCFQISTRSIANTREMIRIIDIFQENNIIALPYKGSYLAYEYYRDLGLREFSDIDLLVQFEDLSKIKELFINEKYIPELNLKPFQESLFFNIYCEYNFDLYSDSGVRLYHVEPHFRSNHKSYDINFTINDFKDNITSTKLLGHNINTLSKEDHLILTLTNHGINEGWTSLKYIFDFYSIISKDAEALNWSYIILKLNKAHILPSLLVGILICHKLLKLEIPKEITPLLEDIYIKKLTSERLSKISQYSQLDFSSQWHKFIFNLKTRTNVKSKIKMIVYQFLAPSKDDLDIIILPKSLLFLYIIIRPLRVLRDRILNSNRF